MKGIGHTQKVGFGRSIIGDVTLPLIIVSRCHRRQHLWFESRDCLVVVSNSPLCSLSAERFPQGCSLRQALRLIHFPFFYIIVLCFFPCTASTPELNRWVWVVHVPNNSVWQRESHSNWKRKEVRVWEYTIRDPVREGECQGRLEVDFIIGLNHSGR